MPHALVTARDGHSEDHVHRFDPRFWTINFPRPAMASVVTTGPDALRVDLAWHDFGHQSDALVGLIWESADRLSPPLLAYGESRDYANTTLRFRWRSAGCRALDVLHGPVLTVEGLDAAGEPRSWYVRLWNYAVGTPTDALVTLPFDALDGGFLLPGEADRVWPHAIERMFVSLTPDGADTGWAEMSAIDCTGSGATLTIGDALVPPHDLRLATAYDDSFNQTPERLLRAALHLGYRRELLHYVGMSHFMALPVGEGPVLCAPARAWHADYLVRAKALGYDLILSLSFELFDEHCPEAWKQRDADGRPALTGWVPPSTLLSPANDAAVGWLERAARAFADLAREAGQRVRFQVGEPWWWVRDGRLHAHDAATRALVPDAPADVRGPQDAAARDRLDRLGAILADATARVAAAARGPDADAETLLLVYLPTVLDAATPELKRANVPLDWASPAPGSGSGTGFDVLQLEDYDWVTDDRPERSRAGLAAMAERLGYPPARTHYLSGFVLRAEDAGAHWPLIARAAEAARPHVAARFVWALPQVARDGFVYFTAGDETMQPFDDVTLPIAIGQHATSEAEHAVSVVESGSGYESRNADWAGARLRFNLGPGVRSEADVATLIAFFRARRGPARAFRFADPFDASSAAVPGAAVTAGDQPLGRGDGERTRFALVKHYGEGCERRITRPVAGSVRVALDGVPTAGWSLEPGGEVLFAEAPATGASVTAGYEFDVPVRFASDRLEVARATVLAGELASVPLVEVREG